MHDVSPAAGAFDFLNGGEMGALMRSHDWSRSPLGAPRSWPQSLRTVAGLMITSRFPMFVAWGPELAFIYNDGYRPILGAKHPSALGRPFREVWSEIWKDIYPLVERALAGEATFDENLHLVMERNGFPEDTWYTFSYSPVRDEYGRVAGMFCACTETTGQVLAQAALRESEDHYRHTVEFNPQVPWTARPDGQLDHVAQRWRDWTGTSGLGDSWGEAIHPDDLQPTIEAWTRSFSTGVPYDIEHRVRLRDGEYHWMRSRAFPRRDQQGRIVKWYGTTEDIHDRRAAEGALRESEARQRAMIAATPECVKLVARDGRLLEMNLAGLTMIEADDFPSVHGAQISQVIAPEHRAIWQANHARVCRGERLDWEFDIIGLKGTRRRMETHAVPLKMPDGSTAQLAVTRDVTERKRAEEHQSLMINELNHRVKNTLATVQSIASQTLRNATTAQDAREAFEGRLMALSRAHDVLTRENWEGASLREIVTEALAPYRGFGESRFHLEGPPVQLLPRMALALAMAFQELVTNAVKYGALSNAAGEIFIGWDVDYSVSPGRLRLRWREVRGPEVQPPGRRGFGSRLIERSLGQDLGAEVKIDFAPGGVVCEVDAPLPTL